MVRRSNSEWNETNFTKNGEILTDFGVTYVFKDSKIIEKRYKDGGIVKYKDGNIHSDDTPAIEFANGYKEWRLHGIRDRKGGKPSIQNSDGSVEFWENGELLKIKGKNYEIVYKNGKMHKVIDIIPKELYDYFSVKKRFVKNDDEQ